jgi:biotin carboxylase
MKKKILVIGAAQSCLGMIRTIKRMNCKAIVVGDSIDLPGIEQADQFLIADDNNIEDVVEFCKGIKVDGIVPTPVDRPLIRMAKVAAALNLPFLSVSAAINFRNKYKMKKCLQEAGVACAKGIQTTENEFSFNLLQGFEFPLIVKPIDAYASRGVLKIESADDLEECIHEAASFSTNGEILIEEFIDGREFNAEGVCFKGNVDIWAIVEKIRDPFPRTIEMGHIIPPAISGQEEEIIIDTIKNAVAALSMENGAFNAEIKLHQEKGYVIEVNGRLAGDFIISHLIKPTTGQDMEEAVVNISLDIEPERAKRNYLKHGIISFFNLKPGNKINRVGDFQHLHNDPSIIWAFLFFQAGDIIPKVVHMGHRSGFVIVTADSREKMFERAKEAKLRVLNSIEFE